MKVGGRRSKTSTVVRNASTPSENVLSRSGVALPNSYSLSSTDPRVDVLPNLRFAALHVTLTSPRHHQCEARNYWLILKASREFR